MDFSYPFFKIRKTVTGEIMKPNSCFMCNVRKCGMIFDLSYSTNFIGLRPGFSKAKLTIAIYFNANFYLK